MPQFFSNNDKSIIIANSFNSTVPDDESKILAWLSPLEPWVRHRDIGAQRVDGIGAWLLETKGFRCWVNGSRENEADRPTLFCDGNPGVGKSYIVYGRNITVRSQRTALLMGSDNSSLVIDKLCDEAVDEDTVVTCFYFDFAARNEQSPANMLGSLLRQLVNGLEEIPEAIVRAYRKQKRAIGGRRLQVSGILAMFQSLTATKRMFICVDALDECLPEHRMVVLESLRQILQGSPNTRIFMTGRPQVRAEVERKLDQAATFILIQPTEDGVVRYLRETLRNDTTPEIMSSTLEAEIMKSIPEINSETFLFASLHINAILRGTTIAGRRKALKSIKDGAGLGDAYGATLERIKTQDELKTKLAMAALTWVCHSERPLQVDELCHALAVEIGAPEFDPENVPLIGTLLHCCQGLITVDKEASTVRLIHYTVQEYLCGHLDLFSKPHSILAETCLTYLISQKVKSLTSHSLPDYQSMPFLNYSSRYWGTHARRELTDHARALALELLDQYEDHVSSVSLSTQIMHHDYLRGMGTYLLFSGLHCASFFGIVELVTAIINAGGCDVDQQDCRGSTPLSWAAENGHEGVVKILLERGNIDPNRPRKNGRTPLGCAAVKGHEGVVKLLLEQENVDPNRPDANDRTPLGCAAFEGHEAVVTLLLGRRDVDPNRPDKYNQTPLRCAAVDCHEGVVKLLLGREDIDPNCPDANDRTPLGCASGRGHAGVVKLLLEQEGINPNRPDKYDRTPLGCAALKGHDGVVKLLLEREDVDPNRPDKFNQTPLRCAAADGYEGVVKLLLAREDIDPNHPDDNDRTPLGCASCKGYEEVVKLLLEVENVDLNRLDKYDRTPLGGAVHGGHEAVVKLLLEQEEVDPNRPDMYDRTPLGCAVLERHEGVVKQLLEREDVDPNCPDKYNQTPLRCAAVDGHEGVVKLLLAREDVDPNRRDGNHRTPLGCAVLEGHEGVVKLLLEREDIDPNCPDKYNQTPLRSAVVGGHEGVVKLLLGREDIDPNSLDWNDRTSLGCAALEGNEGVVKLLLELEDVDPNRPDKYGQTPLTCAAAEGHAGVVKLLLGREDIDPNFPDANDRTPLWFAAGGGHEGVVKLLLDQEGVNPDRLDKCGDTPLSRADGNGHAGVVKLLLME